PDGPFDRASLSEAWINLLLGLNTLQWGVCVTLRRLSLPARKPSAGAMPGRWGACLAVRTPPAALFLLQSSPVHADGRALGGSRQRDHFPTAARAQGLERWQRRALAHEAHGAVGEGEVGPARMAAAEGAHPSLEGG